MKTIEERVSKAIKERVFPGCVIGTIRANGSREVWPFGTTIYGSEEKVREDTVYDVASITKSIPTASLALTFIAEGKLVLADKVVQYLPELQNDYGASIEDLLRYRVQGVQLSTFKNMSADDILANVFARGFDGPPGDSAYTNLPAFLLGIIIERVGGAILPTLAQRYFFEPLEMKRTTFFSVPRPNAEIMIYHNLIAPTEINERGEVRGLPHDESAYVFAKEGKAVGHAGLFSTAPDLLNFLEALLQGKYPAIVEGAERGLGWQLNEPRFMGTHAGPKTFGKTGFTGTSVVCDIERGIAFVILSNRTYPKRPSDDSAIYTSRSDIADIMFAYV